MMCICVINNCSCLKEKVTFVLCLCYKLSPNNFLSSALGSEGDEVLFRPGFTSTFAKSVPEMRSQVLARPAGSRYGIFLSWSHWGTCVSDRHWQPAVRWKFILSYSLCCSWHVAVLSLEFYRYIFIATWVFSAFLSLGLTSEAMVSLEMSDYISTFVVLKMESILLLQAALLP